MTLPPVIARLIADTRQYTAKMTEAQAQMAELGTASTTTSEKMAAFGSKAATATIGLGLALGGYAVDQAYKFQESLDKVKNQAGLTTAQTDALGKSIQKISNVTGIADSQLTSAALTISQAGVKGAAATNLLTAAAKAAVITNSSVADTTKAIVAAQTLQISKGMDVAKLTGILVAGSHDFVGGLSAEEQMISGRVGVALSKYGLSLQTIIPLGAEFAKAGLPTRSISSFANALGNLEKPMTDSKGKLTAYAQGLNLVGLSQEKLARDLRVGNITGILQQIKAAAVASGDPLNQVAQAVFGSTGSGAASVLVKNLQDLATAQKNLAGAGAGTLGTSFAEALKQIGPQLNVLKANFNNLMINAGKLLLPAVSDILKWVGGFAKAINSNPLLKDLLGAGAGLAFGVAVASKIKGAFNAVMGLFGKSAQTVSLNANTAALEANTIALGGKGTTVVPAGGGGIWNSIKSFFKNPALLAGGTAGAVFGGPGMYGFGKNGVGTNAMKDMDLSFTIIKAIKDGTTSLTKDQVKSLVNLENSPVFKNLDAINRANELDSAFTQLINDNKNSATKGKTTFNLTLSPK